MPSVAKRENEMDTCRLSSVVEREINNLWVVGSNPTRGSIAERHTAKKLKAQKSAFRISERRAYRSRLVETHHPPGRVGDGAHAHPSRGALGAMAAIWRQTHARPPAGAVDPAWHVRR